MDLDRIELTLKEAMAAAGIRPGPYGGRYVARRWDENARETVWFVMSTDDPESVEAKDPKADIHAHVLPNKVWPVGRARYWINEDGTVKRSYFDEKK
jgi:hypothetical protein